MVRFASVPLLALILSCSTPPRAPLVVKEPAAPEIERLDMDLVRRVDAAIQGRFGTLTEQDIKTRRFGISRMGPRDIAHPLVYKAESDADRDMVARLSMSGWKGAFFALADGDQEVPGGLKGPLALGSEKWDRKLDKPAVYKLGLKSKAECCAIQSQQGDVVLEARPVFATQKICLRCHPSVKSVGDPVGAVVYAFVKGRVPVATSGK